MLSIKGSPFSCVLFEHETHVV